MRSGDVNLHIARGSERSRDEGGWPAAMTRRFKWFDSFNYGIEELGCRINLSALAIYVSHASAALGSGTNL